MKNLNMGIKLGLGFGFVLFLTCMLGYMSYGTLSKTSHDADTIAIKYIPVVDMTINMETAVRGAFLELRTYSLARNASSYESAKKYFASAKQYATEMTTFSAKYPDLLALKIFVQKFPSLFSTYIDQATNLDDLIVKESVLSTKMDNMAVIVDKGLMKQVDAMGKSATEAAFEGVAGVVAKNIDNLILAESVRMMFLDIRRIIGFAQVSKNLTHLKAGVDEMEKLDKIMDILNDVLLNTDTHEIVVETREALESYHSGKLELEIIWKDLAASDKTRDVALEALLTEVEHVTQVAMDETEKLSNVSSVRTTEAVWENLYIVIGVLVIGTFIAVLLTRVVTNSLRTCLEYAQGVASGNLDQRLDIHSRDEIGRLSDALRSMVATLKDKIGEANEQSLAARNKEAEALAAMRKAEEATSRAERAKSEGMLAAAERLEGTVNSIGSALVQLSAQIDQSERGAAAQAVRVTETATAMEEMNSTVLEVARNASQASEVSGKTRERAVEGADVVNKVVRSIESVRTGALAMKDDMVTLDQHARAISQIMSVISDIADQTNLLALNAAIEAARAGEAGRGFAVVADEVRKLAEKTMASTTDVGNAIKAIQESADRSMSQVDVTVQGVEETTIAATKSGQSLEEIVKMTDMTADQVRAIATASEEQSSTSEEINHSILEVNAIAGETANAMQEAARAIANLSTQSNNLSKLVDELKRG